MMLIAISPFASFRMGPYARYGMAKLANLIFAKDCYPWKGCQIRSIFEFKGRRNLERLETSCRTGNLQSSQVCTVPRSCTASSTTATSSAMLCTQVPRLWLELTGGCKQCTVSQSSHLLHAQEKCMLRLVMCMSQSRTVVPHG
eukprot:6482617-Amphidinium_carterae.1